MWADRSDSFIWGSYKCDQALSGTSLPYGACVCHYNWNAPLYSCVATAQVMSLYCLLYPTACVQPDGDTT